MGLFSPSTNRLKSTDNSQIGGSNWSPPDPLNGRLGSQTGRGSKATTTTTASTKESLKPDPGSPIRACDKLGIGRKEEKSSRRKHRSTGPDEQGGAESGKQVSDFRVKWALTLVYCAIFVIGVAGNMCNCLVIADSRNRYMKTATNYYLFSLSISDLLLLIFGVPHDLIDLWHPSQYLFGQFVCIARGWISEASTNASVLVIVAFSVERYLAICHPLRAHTLSHLSRAVKIILLIWLVASTCALTVVWQLGIETVRLDELGREINVTSAGGDESTPSTPSGSFGLADDKLIVAAYGLSGDPRGASSAEASGYSYRAQEGRVGTVPKTSADGQSTSTIMTTTLTTATTTTTTTTDRTSCTAVALNETIFELSVIMFFIVPMAVMTILYVKLGYHLRKKAFFIKQNRLAREQHLQTLDGQPTEEATTVGLTATSMSPFCPPGATPTTTTTNMGRPLINNTRPDWLSSLSGEPMGANCRRPPAGRPSHLAPQAAEPLAAVTKLIGQQMRPSRSSLALGSPLVQITAAEAQVAKPVAELGPCLGQHAGGGDLNVNVANRKQIDTTALDKSDTATATIKRQLPIQATDGKPYPGRSRRRRYLARIRAEEKGAAHRKWREAHRMGGADEGPAAKNNSCSDETSNRTATDRCDCLGKTRLVDAGGSKHSDQRHAHGAASRTPLGGRPPDAGDSSGTAAQQAAASDGLAEPPPAPSIQSQPVPLCHLLGTCSGTDVQGGGDKLPPDGRRDDLVGEPLIGRRDDKDDHGDDDDETDVAIKVRGSPEREEDLNGDGRAARPVAYLDSVAGSGSAGRGNGPMLAYLEEGPGRNDDRKRDRNYLRLLHNSSLRVSSSARSVQELPADSSSSSRPSLAGRGSRSSLGPLLASRGRLGALGQSQVADPAVPLKQPALALNSTVNTASMDSVIKMLGKLLGAHHLVERASFPFRSPSLIPGSTIDLSRSRLVWFLSAGSIFSTHRLEKIDPIRSSKSGPFLWSWRRRRPRPLPEVGGSQR